MRTAGVAFLGALVILSGAVPAQEQATIQAIKKVKPSVVSVRTWKDGSRSPGKASGIVFRADGYVLTNAHVVKGARLVNVTLGGQAGYRARVWGVDPNEDLAVLRVDAQDLPVPTAGNSSRLEQGQTVIAIGDPMGLTGSSRVGTISGLSRDQNAAGIHYHDLIQTDAALGPGSSGGALVNRQGELIGVNTLMLPGRQGAPPLAFAIPINRAWQVADRLSRSARSAATPGRPWLGISSKTLTADEAEGLPARHGVLVLKVKPGSPAAQADLRVGDLIVEAAGQPVLSQADLAGALARHAGERIGLALWRQGKKLTLEVQVELQSSSDLFQEARLD